MKLIEINPINDAHAMLIIEAFNKYIIYQINSDNVYGAWGDGNGEGDGDGLAFSEEYKEQWEASQELQYGDARRRAKLHDAFADVE